MHSDDGCKYQEGTGKLRCIFDPFCSPLMNLMTTVAVLQVLSFCCRTRANGVCLYKEPADDVSESCIASEAVH